MGAFLQIAYKAGLRAGFRESFVKQARYPEAAILGALGGGLLGHKLGKNYGFWLAGDSPQYRDVKQKELLWGVLGALSGAALGTGASLTAARILEHSNP
jgi:hypothetical protein